MLDALPKFWRQRSHMASLSAHLAKSLLQTATPRRPNIVRASICTASLSRRWFSDAATSTAASSTAETTVAADAPDAPVKKRSVRKPKVAAPSTAESSTEVPADAPDAPVKKRPGRKPKADAGDPPAKKRLGRPPKYIITANELAPEAEPYKPKAGRPKKSDAPRPAKLNLRPRKPQVVKVTAPPASLLELPPGEHWHHYFPARKDWSYRTTISNVESARKLAESFVPEGSKDKVVIEVNPGQLLRNVYIDKAYTQEI